MKVAQLGYVPPFLPDETIYSCLASYCVLFPDANLTCRLLGPKRTNSRADWPVGLQLIAQALPSNLAISAFTLFYKHSLAPAHLPFMSDARRTALAASMRQVRAGEPARIAKAKPACIKTPDRLRICPECWQRDIHSFGRAYIHRVHQFAGVVVCAEHTHSALQDTNVFRNDPYRRKAYIDINHAAILGPSAILDSERERSVAVKIAKIFDRLLQEDTPHRGPEHIRRLLRVEIIARGYVFPGGRLHLRKFQNAFVHWFTPTLASAVGICRPSAKDNGSWIYRYLTRKTDAIHPILPVLLAIFMGVDLINLMNRDLNHPIRPQARAHRPPGVSEAYARFESNRALLVRLWGRHDLSLADLARRLKASGLTIRRWAVAGNLPFPRPGPRIILAPVERPHRPDTRLQITANRASWKWLLKIGVPGPSRNPKSRRLYWWLTRYDRRWLRRNMPKNRTRVSPNWADRDRFLASRVASAATTILTRIPPVRVSKTRIAHELRQAPWLLGYRKHFPKTTAKLREFEESRSNFVGRCLVGKTINKL
jgi:hypothetical protein